MTKLQLFDVFFVVYSEINVWNRIWLN